MGTTLLTLTKKYPIISTQNYKFHDEKDIFTYYSDPSKLSEFLPYHYYDAILCCLQVMLCNKHISALFIRYNGVNTLLDILYISIGHIPYMLTSLAAFHCSDTPTG